MFRIQGLIDFARLEPASLSALEVDVEGALHRARLPGIDLRWQPDCVDIAAREGCLAIAAGRTRPTHAPSGEASAWLERYARQGPAAADAVDGEFATVIVDCSKRRATLFVDRFAIQPLCYRAIEGTLAFSDAARAVPGRSNELDRQSLYDYLYFHVIPGPQTVFRDVRRVEPGHRAVATASGSESRRYWEPRFVENDRHDLAGRLQEFVAIIERCVAEQAGDTPVACFLSGGTDSSTIAGMLSRVRGEPVHAYSIGFATEGYDEMEYARIAARHFGLAHHEYYVTPDDVLSAVPRLAASFDQPFGNSSVLPAYYCALRAKNDGFDRMLAGDGGDELFGGNSRYAMQKVFDAYRAIPASLRTRLEPAAAQWTLFRRVPGFKQLGGYVRHSRLPMPDRLHSFNVLHRLDDESILEPNFRAAIDTEHPIEQQRATWSEIHAASLVNRMLAYDWKYTLADSDLPKVQAAANLAGVAVGYPLLARALTDFSLALPPDWKVKGLKLRWFFKEALRDFLPREILRKHKHGFGLPFGHWTLQHDGLRGLAEESLSGLAQRGIVRPQFTSDLMSRMLPSAPSYYGETVWILLMLEQWLRACDVVPTQSFTVA